MPVTLAESCKSRRWAWAEIDLAALQHNVRECARLAKDVECSQLYAVVKADAYGHGAVQCARAALAAGATGLAVAFAHEGLELREAGSIDDHVPIVVLSEQPPELGPDMIRAGLEATLYGQESIALYGEAAAEAGCQAKVHLKIDTGMHRHGCEVHDALRLARQIVGHRWLVLEGVCSHIATEPGHSNTQRQIDAFSAVVAALHADAIYPPQVIPFRRLQLTHTNPRAQHRLLWWASHGRHPVTC